MGALVGTQCKWQGPEFLKTSPNQEYNWLQLYHECDYIIVEISVEIQALLGNKVMAFCRGQGCYSFHIPFINQEMHTSKTCWKKHVGGIILKLSCCLENKTDFLTSKGWIEKEGYAESSK